MTGASPKILPLDRELPDLVDWRGDVVCERVAGRSTLTRCYSRSPLKLLAPDPVGRAASVVMSSFGGGLVSGDDVPIRVRVDGGAACVLSTQSSSKVYRSDGRTCSQTLRASVADDGLLAIVTDPICCYADARFTQSQSFHLAPGGNLVWLDWLTSGRWACDERWQFTSLRTRADVRVGDRLVLRESLSLENDAGDLAVGNAMRAGRFNCYVVLAIVGPTLGAMRELARRAIDAVDVGRDAPMLASAAPIGSDGGLVVRLLAPDARDARRLLQPIIAALADVVGGDPWARKW